MGFLNKIIWFLILIFPAFPIAFFCAFFYIWCYCFEGCSNCCGPIAEFFLKCVRLPGTSVRGMFDGRSIC
ncbi:hypothetical protein HHI36_013878 [Cryptolaemus montrouzieri]|uniref:Uncharacterized protein n=1 Tax=Cryptolaemus montrouzieri TaxID=559131 RepID=A0ABD2N1I0_9CUCU